MTAMRVFCLYIVFIEWCNNDILCIQDEFVVVIFAHLNLILSAVI